MAEESYGFNNARTRLEEIVSQVRKKDTSLEKSLDLLEEGVRLANQCTELIDHVDWDIAAGKAPEGEAAPEVESADATDDAVSDAADGESGEAQHEARDDVAEDADPDEQPSDESADADEEADAPE